MAPKVLVIGGGGREHALVKQLSGSPQQPTLFTAPGNPGTAAVGSNVSLDPANPADIVSFCQDQGITLVVVGPEDPLIAGLADQLRAAGIVVFGPGAAGARLEGDKEYAKQVMAAAGVPTAPYTAFASREEALAHLEQVEYPVVVKACGAAQGKGVAVCGDRREAAAHVDLCLGQHKFGSAGKRILIEECLTGPELSVLAVTDGEACALLAPSRDHKRIGEGDTGPNTGGMGAFAPVPVSGTLATQIVRDIITPVLAELRRQHIAYRGVLYAGLMLTPSGPQVLEFNCRFGDPEAQVVLPLLTGDFLALLQATAAGSLGDHLAQLAKSRSSVDREDPLAAWPGAGLTEWHRHCVVVVGAAAGYPGAYTKGETLILPADRGHEAWIIHAGTGRHEDQLVTQGGRVLGAVGTGESLARARGAAYQLLAQIDWPGMTYRRDIAGAERSAGGSA
jgi:phosphoribosylamine--glycine ligase